MFGCQIVQWLNMCFRVMLMEYISLTFQISYAKIIFVWDFRWVLLKLLLVALQFWLLMQAIDHIINSAAKSNYMSSGQISVPIVFRGPNGAAAGVGAQHSHVWWLCFLIYLSFCKLSHLLCLCEWWPCSLILEYMAWWLKSFLSCGHWLLLQSPVYSEKKLHAFYFPSYCLGFIIDHIKSWRGQQHCSFVLGESWFKHNYWLQLIPSIW